VLESQYIRMIASAIKSNRGLLEESPDKFVEYAMEQVKSYGFAAKVFLRMNWGKVEALLKDPDKLLEELRKEDREAYELLSQRREWLSEVSSKLLEELKKFVGK